MASTLLQGVLRNSAADLDKRAANGAPAPDKDDSDDELVNVVSLPGTPARSQPASRPASPTRGAASRRLPGPLHLTSTKATTDPLKAFATEISQRIFGYVSISDLARAARVSRKWRKSQTLNYVWFQHY
ncbi:hypothetical protein FA95DRAFT_1504112, partial [Auriscalpium vulgare]